jgi:HK97 family phage major capsid protein
VQGTVQAHRAAKGPGGFSHRDRFTAAAATFTWQEMNSLKHAIDPAYRGGPKFRWAFNDGTLQVIEEMVDDQKRPLWLPDVVGGSPATVLVFHM